MVKRKRYRFRQGDVIDVEEFHDGRYGGPGTGRAKRAKPTEEQMRVVNAQNKAKRCRQRMLEYFKEGDIFATWTYEVRNRPPDMQAALKDFQKAMRYVRREFKKRGYEVFWIRNIERGTKGAWHIHLVINEIGDTASIITKAYKIYRDHTEVRRSIFLRARRAYLRLRKQVQRRMEIALDLAYRCISYYGWFKNSDSVHFKKKYGIEQLMKYAKRRVSIESKIHNRTASSQLAAA